MQQTRGRAPGRGGCGTGAGPTPGAVLLDAARHGLERGLPRPALRERVPAGALQEVQGLAAVGLRSRQSLIRHDDQHEEVLLCGILRASSVLIM